MRVVLVDSSEADTRLNHQLLKTFGQGLTQGIEAALKWKKQPLSFALCRFWNKGREQQRILYKALQPKPRRCIDKASSCSDLDDDTLLDSFDRSTLSMTRPDFPDNALYRSTASHAKRATQPAHATVHEANTSGPRQFIPYLYICPPRSPDAIPAGPWTHILRLFPPSKTRPAGASGLSAHALDLHLPSAAFTNTRALHLSEEHLLLARDFLALALPYYASAHPVEPSSPFARSGRAYTPITHAPLQGMMRMPQPLHSSRADPVRVLVIGPPRAALAIALTYLAYASGCTVAEVMHGVRDGDADAEWRRMLGKDGQMGLGRADMGTLERVAIQEM